MKFELDIVRLNVADVITTSGGEVGETEQGGVPD